MFEGVRAAVAEPDYMPPQGLVWHDYRRPEPGHQVVRAAPDTVFLTGHGIQGGDRLVLDDGMYKIEVAMPYRDSDLHLCRLQPFG